MLEHAEKKQNNSRNIFGQYKDSLMAIIFQGLCITEDYDENIEETVDEIAWTVSRACGALLIEIAALLQDQILAETIQFASGKLTDPTNQAAWQDHYVGMIALGSVMDGPSVDAI